MDAANWITIMTALVGAAAGYGASQAKIASQAGQLGQLDARLREQGSHFERELADLRAEMRGSNERQGERLGKLEAWREAVLAVDRERVRRSTGAIPVDPMGAGPGRDES
jgi:hypothetical protein